MQYENVYRGIFCKTPNMTIPHATISRSDRVGKVTYTVLLNNINLILSRIGRILIGQKCTYAYSTTPPNRSSVMSNINGRTPRDIHGTSVKAS